MRTFWLLFGMLLMGAAFLEAQVTDPGAPLEVPRTPPPVPPSPIEALPVPPDPDYHTAFLNYKTGKFEEARKALDPDPQLLLNDDPRVILRSKIYMELGRFSEAGKMLEAQIHLSNAHLGALLQAKGDLLLRQHFFTLAAEAYQKAMPTGKEVSPDFLLNCVYAEIGSGDLLAAQKFLSQLKPFDVSVPAYYFAKAALDRSTGDRTGEQQEIQTARTLHGFRECNEYYQDYLRVFSPLKSDNSSGLKATSR